MHRSLVCSLGLAAAVLLGVSAQVQAQFTYVEVGSSSGIQPCQLAEGYGSGISAADYDDDGDIDVFVATDAMVPHQLYRNMGNGQFEEIAAQVGLDSIEQGRAALWLDYDGDSDLDLFVSNDDETLATGFRLYRQEDNGQFQDVTVAAGLFIAPELPPKPQFMYRGGVAAGDLNRDGHIDLVVPAWKGHTQVFLNNCDGTFSDVSESSNIGSAVHFADQAMMADFNNDGWLDVYITVDFLPNLLWLNAKDGTFIESAALAGLDNAMNDMGMAFGDYDRDGDFDIYIANIFGVAVGSGSPEYNVLLRNDSKGSVPHFTEVAIEAGVDDGSWGWGATFTDSANNGWLDIAATNGWRSGAWLTDSSKFFLNVGGDPPSFTDVSDAVQFNDTFYGSCLVSFDYDRDGDLDLMQSCQTTPLDQSQVRLLENQQQPPYSNNSYLVVRPRMNGPNHRAIGAVVRVTFGGESSMHLITAGTSYLGQEPAEAFFGMGNSPKADTLTIEWPDRSTTVLTDIPANQVYTFTHGGFGDLNASGDADLDDLECMLDGLSGLDSCPGVTGEVMDLVPCAGGDGEVNLYDLVALLGALSGNSPCQDSCF